MGELGETLNLRRCCVAGYPLNVAQHVASVREKLAGEAE